METRVSVKKRRGQWLVTVDGMTMHRAGSRKVALTEARSLGRDHAPAYVEAENRHGAWKTIATY
ncbi:MAG: hypothetical protein ABEI98_02500 [Halorhabdus sp.]